MTAGEETSPGQSCPKCGGDRDSRCVNVVEASCWNCDAPMKIAFGGATGGPSPHPGDFTERELAAARQAGAKLEHRFSRTTQSEYLANVCPHCDKITGDFYLHDYWHLASASNEVSRTFECRVCDLGLAPLPKRRPRAARKAKASPTVETTPALESPITSAAAVARKQLWGSCGSCHKPASPINTEDGKFYCGFCHRTAVFVPDS